jgi:tetratricopeptide (TPR) repeat protein
MKRIYQLVLMLGLLAVVVTAQGCGVINQLRAKNSLNEGVREFNKGKFDTAEQKFATALDLSKGQLANAGLFYARAVYQQYDQKRNDETAQKALEAYQAVIDRNKDNEKLVDTALAFKADVYDKMSKSSIEKGEGGRDKAVEYKKLQQDTLLERANLAGATKQTKAAVFYTIGQGFWVESYNLSHYAINYDGTLKQPLPPDRVAKMQPNIDKALEYLNKALEFDPEYADAWSYKKLTLMQQNYITTDPAKKTALDAQIKAADAKTKALYEQRKKEAEAQQSAS